MIFCNQNEKKLSPNASFEYYQGDQSNKIYSVKKGYKFEGGWRKENQAM